MSEPLKPSATLLVKLGSIIVHADELLAPGGHAFDRIALQQLLADKEVSEWLDQMGKLALIPLKR